MKSLLAIRTVPGPLLESQVSTLCSALLSLADLPDGWPIGLWGCQLPRKPRVCFGTLSHPIHFTSYILYLIACTVTKSSIRHHLIHLFSRFPSIYNTAPVLLRFIGRYGGLLPGPGALAVALNGQTLSTLDGSTSNGREGVRWGHLAEQKLLWFNITFAILRMQMQV